MMRKMYRRNKQKLELKFFLHIGWHIYGTIFITQIINIY
ncbi:unnamed protein product [Arabidopsis halleri]